MNFLKRYFSVAYPYHLKPKNLAQALIDFPLQFDSEEPDIMQEKHDSQVENNKFLKEEGDSEGIKAVFETLLSSIAQENFISLEDLVEFNMLKKLKTSWEEYKKLGYKIMTTGSIDDAKVTVLDKTCTSGNFLPYRNLNFPKSEYEYTLIPGFKRRLPIHSYRIEDRNIKRKYLNDFLSLDFKKINQDENIEQYLLEIKEIFVAMGSFPIFIATYDIGILSSYKLYVVDQNNAVCGGSNDPNKKEFHSLRLDYMTLPSGYLWNMILKFLKCDKFFSEKFTEWLRQYTIVDIDGFMDGNPILR
ncbi:unnamed protein product [Blepharisma stoltei]|uniref:Uncharacterized protein n=1 Tax=Blepharisma stoltei TaxID=1481888 RepID=A0AAU9JW49_9CILI|nr:unnamed protein product [Blepharisma stoltei]